MAKNKTVYVCQNCGAEAAKWVGKCPSCGEWNTYVEEIIRKDNSSKKSFILNDNEKNKPICIDEVEVLV